MIPSVGGESQNSIDMDLNTIIRSENAEKIQLVVNAKDLRDLLDGAMAFAMKTITERDEPDYYTRQELADKFHVSLVTLGRWVDGGKLPEPVKMIPVLAGIFLPLTLVSCAFVPLTVTV